MKFLDIPLAISQFILTAFTFPHTTIVRAIVEMNFFMCTHTHQQQQQQKKEENIGDARGELQIKNAFTITRRQARKLRAEQSAAHKSAFLIDL
jgi:hypothetical protein